MSSEANSNSFDKTVQAAFGQACWALAVFRPSTGKLLFANEAFCELVNVGSDNLTDKTFYFCIGESGAGEVRSAVGSMGEGGDRCLKVETPLEIPLLPTRTVEIQLTKVKPTPNRSVVCALLTDITERSDRLGELELKLHRLEGMVNDTLQAVIVNDMTGKIMRVSRGATRLLGYPSSEMVGKMYIQDIYEGDAAREVRELLPADSHGGPDRVYPYQGIIITKQRQRLPVRVAVHQVRDEEGEELAIVSYVHDMADLIEMERKVEAFQLQLIHADKMASLGKLAAGVAHEINNPLGGILLFGGLLLEDMDFADPKREDVDLIVQEARRCKEIVNSLLDFAHQKKRYHEPVDLNGAVEQCIGLLSNQPTFHNIEIVLELADGLPPVEGNPSQLKQVFTNLVTNAADAMEGDGKLTIRTMLAGGGKRVTALFADTGSGIPAGIRKRIFDPFFTTKEPGKGTGLGLSLSYNIIAMHKGSLEVKCPDSGGTEFTVTLPAEGEDEL